MRLKPWSIKQLYEAMQEDLTKCHTQLERSMCLTLCKKEIREKAAEFRRTRKLTPMEEAILASL